MPASLKPLWGACLGCLVLGLSSIPLPARQARLFEACTRDIAAADSIVVLGYSCDHVRGIPSPTLALRVEAALSLWRRTGASLVFSGGAGEQVRAGLPTEADIMASYAGTLLATGEPPPRILLERKSTSTRENALFSLPTLDCSRTKRTVVIVTSTFHQWRARRVFQAAARTLGLQGCQVLVHPCATRDERVTTQYDWFREIAACALYWYRGWI
ncbi:DUF218 domain-containing protein [Pavlovales sp. CCMP2436]|nr:DUF218 domain-containing protein [Pavlovales sp. CCMP2436]|mmetsp:Transcript_43091/g.106355  ORF Transcript_43091/g.106355 Transcript_43091/m.106355 type:complete len:214 (-) Transcript_43091:67-708(-)